MNVETPSNTKTDPIHALREASGVLSDLLDQPYDASLYAAMFIPLWDAAVAAGLHPFAVSRCMSALYASRKAGAPQ